MLASGERVRASADEHPDLFWAIRGGGGNFGVVTSFLFRLHEVGTVIAGPTFWPVEHGAEVLAVYRDFLPNAPRELNGFFAFLSVPPGPPFPEELHLRKVCGVVWCYVGARGGRAPRRWRRCSTRSPSRCCTGVQAMPHPALQGAFDGLYPAGAPVVLARRLRQRDPRRGDRDPRAVRRRDADLAVDDAPVPDRRRRPRRRRRRHGLELPRREVGARCSPGVDPDPANVDADPRLDASTTSRRCTRTRPAAPT